MSDRPAVALVGDHDPAVAAHRAIPAALAIAARRAGCALDVEWVGTASLAEDAAERLAGHAGIWCVPASPYASTEGALAAIRLARESGRPFLGTCGGFQHALLEYARSVLGLTGAAHAELDPQAALPLIAPLACSLVERSARVVFEEGSRLRAIYGTPSAEEGYHCRYGLNRAHERLLAGGPLAVAARDEAGEVRAIELAGHPFFFATLFQPERSALAGRAHPLIDAYVLALSAQA